MMIYAVTAENTIAEGKLFRIMQPSAGITISYLMTAVLEADTPFRYDLTVTMNNQGIIDQVFINDVSRDLAESKRIFRLFYENTVTPVTAYEVMDDYFASL